MAIFCNQKQYTITIVNPELVDFRELGLCLHSMDGLLHWWVTDTELTLIFDKAFAGSGVLECLNLVNGSLPLTTP